MQNTTVMQSGLNPVALGNGPGWVSGSPANLAVSGTADVVFDLGPEWHALTTVSITLYFGVTPGAATAVAFAGHFSLDGTTQWVRSCNYGYAGTAYLGAITAANGEANFIIAVQGRYLRVRVNGVTTAALAADAAVRIGAHR